MPHGYNGACQRNGYISIDKGETRRNNGIISPDWVQARRGCEPVKVFNGDNCHRRTLVSSDTPGERSPRLVNRGERHLSDIQDSNTYASINEVCQVWYSFYSLKRS